MNIDPNRVYQPIVKWVVEADREWLASHPDEPCRIRDLVPGEVSLRVWEAWLDRARDLHVNLPEGWHIDVWVEVVRRGTDGFDRYPLYAVRDDTR